MTPYYEQDEITIFHGDSLDLVEILRGDALITDPVWPNCPKGLLYGSDDPYLLFERFCARFSWSDCKRSVFILRHDSDPRFLAPVPLAYARAVQLPYVMPGYIGRWLGGDELAYCFGDPIPRRQGQIVIPGRAPQVQPRGRRANGHPCSRAYKHLEFLVRWWSDVGETVIDPFAGSGTTLLAARRMGRRAVGIEIEEKFCEIAADALRLQPRNLEPIQKTLALEVA